MLKHENFILGIFLVSLFLRACSTSENIAPTKAPSLRPIVTTSPSPSVAVATTLTPIPISTLSETEAYIFLEGQLRNNDNCQLPCFWGIIPGKSSTLDAQTRLMSFAGIADIDLLGLTRGSIYFTYPKKDLLIDIGLSYRSKADEKTVQLMKISTQVRHEGENMGLAYGTLEYDELLGAYSLQNILAKYGLPKYIFVRADIIAPDYLPSAANDLSPETFEVTLLYPDQGIFVRYNMKAERTGDEIRGCPSKVFVELWLLSPDTQTSYQAILSSEDQTWESNWPNSKPLEEASNITIEKFYQQFKEHSNDCLETPLSIWSGQ